MLKALCYKPEGRGIEYRWGYWFFSAPNPSSCTMAPGFTQSITEKISGGKGWAASKTDNLTAICEPNVWTILDPRHLTTPYASTACCRDTVCVALCAVLFERGVIFCVTCIFLCCALLYYHCHRGKTHFAVQLSSSSSSNNNNNNNNNNNIMNR
jgi:hypothetical protein